MENRLPLGGGWNRLRGWLHLLFLRILNDFPREAEKIAKKSRAEKIAAREIPAW